MGISIFPEGKTGISWEPAEEPSVNQYYMANDGTSERFKIMKDYHDGSRKKTYWKVIRYYDSANMIEGKELKDCKAWIKEMTYRMVI